MSFVFAVVQPFVRAWAKADVARLRPGWRSAYARPGLLTWKCDDDVDEAVDLGTPWARVWGKGLGTAASIDALVEIARVEARGGALRLHVFACDGRDGEGPRPEDVALAEHTRTALRERLPGLFLPDETACPGDRVLDVICARGDPMYAGIHVHGPGRVATAGGRLAIDVPEDAPSRAYRKLEEMLAWSGIVPRRGEVAVELGAAPGGAAYALLRRGVHVVAVDPAPIEPRVLAYRGPGGARARHVPIPAGGLRAEHLPRQATLLLCDLNLAPSVALRYVARTAARLPGWRAMILTLKINDDRVAHEVPRLLARVRDIASKNAVVRAIQLASHRREIGVAVLRASATQRSGTGDREARARPDAALRRALRTR